MSDLKTDAVELSKRIANTPISGLHSAVFTLDDLCNDEAPPHEKRMYRRMSALIQSLLDEHEDNDFKIS